MKNPSSIRHVRIKTGLVLPLWFPNDICDSSSLWRAHPIYTPRLFTRMSDFFKIEYYILCYIEEGNKHPGLNFAWNLYEITKENKQTNKTSSLTARLNFFSVIKSLYSNNFSVSVSSKNMVLQTNVSVCAKILVALFLCKTKFYYEKKEGCDFSLSFFRFFLLQKQYYFLA